MSKHKNVPAVTEAARAAGKQLAAWGGVETMAKKSVAALEKEAAKIHAAESERHLATGFRLVSDGSHVSALIKTQSVTFQIEGGSIAVTSHG